ncbi:hypothetical protein ACJIZ3_025281 [Penstemon smallii]|uniref:Calcineurin-like phosphoesterase domain-containing protein n=1 Tax=Penstemon smallii TaxID=265156 RepID=A0ABD3TV60_9LAMI
MKEKSWVCTLITQLSLCVAAYFALNLGQPQQKNSYRNILSQDRPLDMHFISVAGGFRPLREQTLLLKQMANVVKIYNARVVVDISELGESDPLLNNATLYNYLQNIPWYTTGTLAGQGQTYFLKKFKIPNGRSLYIIAVDTTLFQDSSSVAGNDQIQWLRRTLNESNGDWRIVVGFHHLGSCDYKTRKLEEKHPFELLQNILLHYGVDAYMSKDICAGNNEGFLLHRVSSLEMVTFFVKLTGETEHKLSFQQRDEAVRKGASF